MRLLFIIHLTSAYFLACNVQNTYVEWDSYTGFKAKKSNESPLIVNSFTQLSYVNYSVDLTNQTFEVQQYGNESCSVMVWNRDIIFISQIHNDFIVVDNYVLDPGTISYIFQLDIWDFETVTFTIMLQTDITTDCVYMKRKGVLVWYYEDSTYSVSQRLLFDNSSEWNCTSNRVYITMYQPFVVNGYFTLTEKIPGYQSSEDMPLIFLLIFMSIIVIIIIAALCILGAFFQSIIKKRNERSKLDEYKGLKKSESDTEPLIT